MATMIMILGESGTGKSTSIRGLNAAETFIVGVIEKPLPFRGYRKDYNVENKNYYVSDDYNKIKAYLLAVSERRHEIKNIIIDDAQYLLAHEFMNRVTEKGFDKFSDMARNYWEFIHFCNRLRGDLNIFFLTHSDTDQHGKANVKTIGKLLEDKISLEGIFTIALHSMLVNGEYKFLTNHDSQHMAKSPVGMFEEQYIDNDLQVVVDRINAYYNEDVSQ